MEESFKNAVTGSKPASPLIITSDWDGTLLCDSFNFELLEFLSDAKKAGHRVILTSSISMDKVIDSMGIFIRSGRRRGYDIADLEQFEFIGKAELKTQNLKSDYSFDDQSIVKQLYKNYVDANIEITIRRDGTPELFTFAQLRERCGLPPRDRTGNSLSVDTCAPA